MNCQLQRPLLLLLLVSVLGAAKDNSAPYTLSRDAVVGRVCNNLVIRLIDNRQPSPAEMQAVADAVAAEVKKDAPEILPPVVPSPSKEIMDGALSPIVPVEFDNNEYIRARVRLYLYGILVRINVLTAFPPMSAAKKIAVQDSLDTLMPSVEAVMESKLLPLNIPEITARSIRDAVSNFQKAMDDQIGNPFLPALWIPLTPGDRDFLINDFTDRLHGSLALIQERTRAWPPYEPNDPEAATRANGIYIEILRPVEAFVASHTADPQRQDLDIRKFAVPGWQEARDQFARVMQKMMKSRVLSPRPGAAP